MMPELCIEMALLFLPKDGTDWRPRCAEGIAWMKTSTLIGDAVNVPSEVALYAFESMGREYMDKNHEWRNRLGSVAYRHWMMSRGEVAGL